MKKLLAVAALLLLGGAAAHADAPYSVTHQNGQKVYTNAGTARYQRAIRHEGGRYSNAVKPPAVKVRRVAAPRPAAARYARATSSGDVPRMVSWWKMVDGQWQPASLDLKAEVERLSRIHDVDPLLVYEVLRQESNFDPSAESPVGALGLMQLMPETAADLGVDPTDPAQNLAGGVAYLAAQLRAFGDARLALAAYNAGPGAVQQYGGVPPYAETQNYVDVIYGSYLASKDRARRAMASRGRR